MNPADAAKVLAVAATLDPRLKPPSFEDAAARAQAWAETLDSRMPVDWAVRQVTRHYAESTDAVMPAHLNAAWRSESRRRAEEEAARRILEEKDGVPMPAELRERWRAAISSTRA